MPRLAVVFDTNVYRGLGHAAFDATRRDESQHSVIAYAHYYVATELLSHLAEQGDEGYGPSLQSLRRLGRHCGRWTGSAMRVEFMQLPDPQIARALFDYTLASDEASIRGYSTIIGTCIDEDVPDLSSYRAALVELRELVQRGEREFSNGLWKKVVLTLDPNADDWQSVIKSPKRAALLSAIAAGAGLDLVAQRMVERAASQCGLVLSDSHLAEAIRRARAVFPTAVHHHNLLIQDLIRNGPDMTRPDRANSVWDHQISYAAAPNARINGTPLVLVTIDPLLLRAADSAGARGHVWSLDEYRTKLANRDQYVALQ